MTRARARRAPRPRVTWWRPALTSVALLVAAVLLVTSGPAPASAAAPSTVAQGIAAPAGTALQVQGYVVGQPTGTSTVVRSGFPNDYALALADAASPTDTSRMLYVQIPSGLRAQHGLQSNPGLLGTVLTVTGTRNAYFSHPGVTSVSAISHSAGATTTPPATTAPPTTPSPGGYYAAASGKSGAALEQSLHQIISTGVRTISYDQVWSALEVTDADPANSADVLLFYSGVSRSASSNGGGQDDWNREHVWPQSHGDFGTSAGPGTDLHHLRPEDVTVNGTRGNKDFDTGGTALAECPGCTTDADSFSPRDAVKGDVARMIFYMSVRYDGGDGFPDLEVNNLSSNSTNPGTGRLSVLLQWNAQDPPDAAEQRRNAIIQSDYQGNRNPFIDHPEYATSIWG